MYIKAAVVLLACAALAHADDNTNKDKRQVGKTGLIIDSEEDREGSATGFAANLGGHGKYFQYAHQPEKDHYEFGHRRGNEHHFNERHEKAHPHAGEFKTKVRWGDKHGGYGEHYWDFNHAGHGHDGEGEESQAVEEYEPYQASATTQQKSEVYKQSSRGKRHPETAVDDVTKFLYDPATGIITDGLTGKIYKLQPLN